MNNQKELENIMEEPPPIFKKWKTWYFAVIFNLVVLIIVFYLFTKYFE